MLRVNGRKNEGGVAWKRHTAARGFEKKKKRKKNVVAVVYEKLVQGPAATAVVVGVR